MAKIVLSNLFKASLWDQLTIAARRKPSYLFSSALLCFSSPFLFSLSSSSAASLSLFSLGGILTAGLSKEYFRLLHIFKNQDHTVTPYKQKEYIEDDQTIASIEYDKDLPMCHIESHDPEKIGRAIAKLMPEQSLEMLEGFYEILPYTLQLLHLPTQSRIFNVHKHIDRAYAELQPFFPPYYDKQISSFVKTLNEYIQKDNEKWVFQRELFTEEHIKKLICLPDIFSMLGCSAVIHKQAEQNAIRLLRNLDWPSLGKDHHTLLCLFNVDNPDQSKPQVTASLTLTPGLIGLSVANDKNLCITINEAGNMRSIRRQKGGIPEIIFIRELIRNCVSIKEVGEYIESHKPLSSHNLAVIDNNKHGAVFQVLPIGSDKSYTMRSLTDQALIVTNHHEHKGEMVPNSESWFDSEQRYQVLTQAIAQGKTQWQLMQSVNVRVTMHTVMFHTQQDRTVLHVKKSNAFSAGEEVPTKEVDLTEIFNKKKLN